MVKEFYADPGLQRLAASCPLAMDGVGLHRGLAHFNTARRAVSCPTPQWRDLLADEMVWRQGEGEFLKALREDVALLLPPADLDIDGFMAWFDHLAQSGPGQQHRLFNWLSDGARVCNMKWFLRQEAVGEAGFDGLLANTQVEQPASSKLALARNGWAATSRGKSRSMHGTMLAAAVDELKLKPRIETAVWPALELANTMAGLAISQRNNYHSLAMGETRAKPDEALIAVLACLRAEAYAFTPVTPLTHQQVLTNRGGAAAASSSDIFGWSLPSEARLLPSDLLLMQQASAVVGPASGDAAGLLTSHVRVARLACPDYQSAGRIAAVGLVAVKP